MYYPETAMLWEVQAVLRSLEFDMSQRENKEEMERGERGRERGMES